MSHTEQYNFSKTALRGLRDAAFAGVIALIVFGPMNGLILDGYGLDFHLDRPFLMAGIVALGRFLLTLSGCLPAVRQLRERLMDFSHRGVTVEQPGDSQVRWKVLILLTIITGLCAPFLVSKYWLTILILALIYVLLGLGLNIVVGFAGLLDLGFVAFYAVGAYVIALGAQYWGLGFWTAIPVAAVLAALAGCILAFPVLRMHGDYLAIVTLGFGEIIRLVLNNWLDFTGGPNGVRAPSPTLFGLEFTRKAKEGGIPFHEYFGLEYSSFYKYLLIYLVLFVIVVALTLFVHRLRNMPMGRAWEALRENEIACRSLGINHVTVKLSAFMMGAMTAGIGGVFFASYQGFVNPTSFTFFESALILAIVVLGGMGSIVGVIIAAFVFTLVPEMLREFADYRVLVFGVVMVLMMIWRPRGLLQIRRKAFKRPRPVYTRPGEAQPLHAASAGQSL
ncbi:high-affinity branched-chain amino acid ABC transporter permease LivM [Motiliproteus sp. SC1-56]|uniref:high-affinity branched-chain amino acid ABC transporter permease LivM n=1 Tax=Motiliproteus sp. SC1-56 TaxID=2799565 RepID=UPI001A8ECC35|nr:high-affinity branched-chain amino acid ABC transporter permease LivM [Motiliproteus sp. SC1-56]